MHIIYLFLYNNSSSSSMMICMSKYLNIISPLSSSSHVKYYLIYACVLKNENQLWVVCVCVIIFRFNKCKIYTHTATKTITREEYACARLHASVAAAARALKHYYLWWWWKFRLLYPCVCAAVAATTKSARGSDRA